MGASNTDSNTDRVKSGRLAVRFLADPEVRESFRRASVPSDAPVIVCEWDTSMGEVMAMIKRAVATTPKDPEHAIIAFRRDEDMHTIIATSSKIQILGDYISASDVHANSSIGHVYEALEPNKRWQFDFVSKASAEPAVVSIDGFNFELV